MLEGLDLIVEVRKMHRKESKQKLTLCPACGACPEVAVYEDEVWIGEKGNLAKLRKEEWNQLVDAIQKGILAKVGNP